jgi:hypothetical protein
LDTKNVSGRCSGSNSAPITTIPDRWLLTWLQKEPRRKPATRAEVKAFTARLVAEGLRRPFLQNADAVLEVVKIRSAQSAQRALDNLEPESDEIKQALLRMAARGERVTDTESFRDRGGRVRAVLKEMGKPHGEAGDNFRAKVTRLVRTMERAGLLKTRH